MFAGISNLTKKITSLINHRLVGLILTLVLFSYLAVAVNAQTRPSPAIPNASPDLSENQDSTIGAELDATSEAEASPAAQVREVIEERRSSDLTETTGEAKGRLSSFLEQTPAQPLGPTNFVQHAIRKAVDQGVPANVLVLILLFPVVASLIATSRHIIGLQGFGVYIPAVLAVALLSTGIITGIFLFIVILISASIGRTIFKKFKLQYLPRTALVLWLVALTVFSLLLVSPQLIQFEINLAALSIFPILVLILLSENFIEAQLAGTRSRAIELTIETVLLAVLSTIFMRAEIVQRFVIIYPELTIITVLAIDILVGRFKGLRLAEYLRFRPIIDPEE